MALRLFIGIRPDDDARARISQQADKLRPFIPGRYVAADLYHLTLAFLGQRNPESLERLRQTLKCVAGESFPFELRFTATSAFGRESNAIVYAECASSPELLQLGARLRNQLSAVGESFDPKPLVPHVTLIRKAALPPDALSGWLEPVLFRVSQLTMFHSTRVDGRLTYQPIFETPLHPHSKEVETQ